MIIRQILEIISGDSLLVLVIFLLIINLFLVIKMRRLSQKLGGQPPKFSPYNFTSYIYKQSKTPEGRRLRLFLILDFISMFMIFTLLFIEGIME